MGPLSGGKRDGNEKLIVNYDMLWKSHKTINDVVTGN